MIIPRYSLKTNSKLEPFISAQIMELHHKKHHAAYGTIVTDQVVANLNIASEKFDSALAKNDIKSVIALQPAIKFNGGGHINHTFFWDCLTPAKSSAAELKHGNCKCFYIKDL
jgi:Fe-Mn family superoxide dismutase